MARSAAVILVSLALAGCSQRQQQQRHQAAPAAVARLAAASGEVGYRRAATVTWGEAKAGLSLFARDALKTGARSSARVEFTASSRRLEIDEQSLVVIEPPPAVPARPAPPAPAGAPASAPAPVARLEKGTLRGTTPPGAPAEVHLPDGRTARIVAEGKEPVPYRVRLRRDGKVEVAVLKGAARVSVPGHRGGAPREARVEARHSVDLSPAGGISAARPLPAFPELESPAIDAKFHAGVTVPLRWRPAQNASLYRVQLSESIGFERSLVDETVTVPELSLNQPRAGKTYAWRVSSLDRDGRESEFGFARRFFVLSAPPPPSDELLSPPDNAGLQYIGKPRSLTFRWRGTASEWELVISKVQKLDPAFVRRHTAETSVTLTDLHSGFYFWGVYALDGEQRRPIFKQARRLVIARRVPPGMKVPSSIDWR